MAPVQCTRLLHTRLVQEKIPTVMHIIPQTDHAFDLQLPKISPSAHNAIYDVERFLALMVSKEQIIANKRPTAAREQLVPDKE